MMSRLCVSVSECVGIEGLEVLGEKSRMMLLLLLLLSSVLPR
jgi:hypothetical protein